MSDLRIGIIGGSGLYESGIFIHSETVKMTTPFGSPSAHVEIGTIEGVKVAFLPRHGKEHIHPPHAVNYRANVWVMKELGVERLISPSAVGSLKEEYEPGNFCTPDQFVDFTKGRRYTFFDGGSTYHISTADPFCPELSKLFQDKGKALKLKVHPKGTYVCVEGPRFSTRAESNMFRQYADIIGMTLVPEINLAIESGMCYVSIAMVTDYDVWAQKPVDAKDVIATMHANSEHVRNLIKATIPAIKARKCKCGDVIRNAGI